MGKTREACVVIPAYNEAKYIEWPLFRLHLEGQAIGERIPVVVVDNGSTDDTVGIVTYLAENFGGLDVHLIDEVEKGTGVAVDTGFRYAIEELNREIILRTDADCGPVPPWFSVARQRHRDDPGLHLLTGPQMYRSSTPLPDSMGYPVQHSQIRQRDLVAESLLILSKNATRLIRAFRHRDPALFYAFAPGYNLSTTAVAYKETGGFPKSSIQEMDEDLEYNLRVRDVFGFRSKKYDKRMLVEHSIRRQKIAGYIKTGIHYANVKSRESSEVDIR